jgi:chromate transport protein ChrA
VNALPIIFEIALYFAGLSLVAIGGASAVIPDLYRHLVQTNAWMTGQEFAALIALAQAAPGPNVLIVALLGWKLAGIPGGLGVIVFFLQIDTLTQKNSSRDKHLQNRLSETPCAFSAD